MAALGYPSPKLDELTARRVDSITKNMGWALMWSQRYRVPVLPCDPATKSPMVEGGKLSASLDPAQIVAWWSEFPDAMIGGRCDGLVVLDFDAYKRGHAEDLTALGDLPATRCFVTPGRDGIRGRHLVYFDPEGRCRSTKLGRNRTIDVRAGTSNDYIVLPPSVEAHGRAYRATDMRTPVLAPAWLLEGLRDRPVASESLSDGLPPREPLPRSLSVVVPAEADPSEHTYLLARNGLRACLTPGQVRTLLEDDDVTRERLQAIRRQQPGWWPEEFWRVMQRAQDEVTQGTEDEKASTAQVVLQIARRDFEIGQTTDHVPYSVPREGPRIAQVFRGGKNSLRSGLAMRFEQQLGRPPSQNALSEAMLVLEGIADTRPTVKLPLRVARSNGELVLDLGTPDGRAVIIGPGTWKVVDRSPVMFTRTDLTLPLPEPVRGGKLSTTLLPMLNLSGADRDLVVAIILSWLWPDIDHPVIYLRGEEGTAKSTAAKLLRRLIDPSSVEVKRQPGKDEDWEVSLAGQWGVVLDNLSTLPDWLSDGICTAVSEVGDVKRKKYSDQDLSVIQLRRCFILTSIDHLVSRGDLIDRTCLFDLLPIEKRKTVAEIERDWELMWPLALGAMLDLACRVMSLLPEIEESGDFRTHRLADFMFIAAAMDRAAGTHAVDQYKSKVAEGVRSSVEQDVFAAHLLALADNRDGYWEGTTQDLFASYQRHLRPGGSASWPKTPQTMGNRISRISGVLRKSGIEVSKMHTRTTRGWVIRRIGPS